MLPLKKIYIDSRDRTPDSNSASKFKIQLPYTVQMPENTVFFVTDVCIPHVWKTIETDFNDRIYLIYASPPPGSPTVWTTRSYMVQLDEGNYTLTQLATHLQTKLNEALNADAKAVTSFVVTPSTNNNSLTISLSGNNSYVWFNILTDAEAVSAPSTYWERFDPQNPQAGNYDRGNPRSANDVLTRISPMANTTSNTTRLVNLSHINNVFITSPNLGPM